VHVHERGALRVLQQLAVDDLQRAPEQARQHALATIARDKTRATGRGHQRRTCNSRRCACAMQGRRTHRWPLFMNGRRMWSFTSNCMSTCRPPSAPHASAASNKVGDSLQLARGVLQHRRKLQNRRTITHCTSHQWAHQVHAVRHAITEAAAQRLATQHCQRVYVHAVARCAGCSVCGHGGESTMGITVALGATLDTHCNVSKTSRLMQAGACGPQRGKACAWHSSPSPSS